MDGAWGGSAGALREKKRGGYRPRHALGHGRIYNLSNNVGCWANIHLLPMVPMENIAFAVRTWPVHGGSAGALREKEGVDTDHATLLAMVESSISQIM